MKTKQRAIAIDRTVDAGDVQVPAAYNVEAITTSLTFPSGRPLMSKAPFTSLRLIGFSPDGKSMYIADFGIMTVSPMGLTPQEGTDVIWKITKQ